MVSENGEWIMQGADPSDPSCLHTVEDLEAKIEEIGFLPLFAGEVPGFSVEEMTSPADWWCGDPAVDPWEWRAIVAGRGRIAYGKFFHGRAGFVSHRYLPAFANYRRDGYDFDARWDDELADIREKKIMDLFAENHEDRELYTFEIRNEAGFRKGGEKNFEGMLTRLQMEFYLVCCGLRQRTGKEGKPYGWPISVYCLPEHLFGYDTMTAEYASDPADSLQKLASRVRECFPESTDEQILNLIAWAPDRPKKKEQLVWPRNLLRDLERQTDPESWNDDQISGLFVAIGQLRPKHRKTIEGRYLFGMSNEEIGAAMNRAAGTISGYRRAALDRLRSPLVAAWYRDGYRQNLKACAAGRQWTIDTGNPGDSITEEDLCLRIGLKVTIFESLMRAGIFTVHDLKTAVNANPFWYRKVAKVGPVTAKEIGEKLERFCP